MSEIRSNTDIGPCLAVVMPVYNEAATVVEIVKTVLLQRPVQQLIIVDDASTDTSGAILEGLVKSDTRIHLMQHARNLGKGAALRTGFAAVTAPYAIIQDADLECDPKEYHLLLEPVLNNVADVVFGTRFRGHRKHRVHQFLPYCGNRFLTLASNIGTNLHLSDMETCYKLFRREIIQKIKIEEDRFGFEPEITAKVAALKVRIYEVAISYNGRTYAEGKKIGWRDAFHALWCILKYNLFKR
jgi:glycosyltransferase involved in cell wall biosynthesis